MRCIILAGGNGNKLFPFSATHQKCCLPIGNTANIVSIINHLHHIKITDITILVNYLSQEVISLCSNYHVKFQSTTNIINELTSNEDCLVIHGDIVCSEQTIAKVLTNYQLNGNTALVKPYRHFESRDYIGAQVQDGQVIKIYGHSRGDYANYQLGGIYVVNKDIMAMVKTTNYGFDSINTGQMPDGEYHFENTLVKALEQKQTISMVEDEFIDLDFPWDLFDANKWWCKNNIENMNKDDISTTTKIDPSAVIKGRIKTGKNVIIGANVIIKGNCIIEDDCTISDGAIIYPNCLIGQGSQITDGCKINSYSVIGPKNKIGFSSEFTGVSFEGMAQVHYSEIYGIVGRYVDIAAGCVCGILRFDDQLVSNKVQDKYYATASTNIICIGDNTRTGINNIIYPGIKIGTQCALGPGLIIKHDIDNNQLVMPLQEVVCKDWGSKHYGW